MQVHVAVKSLYCNGIIDDYASVTLAQVVHIRGCHASAVRPDRSFIMIKIVTSIKDMAFVKIRGTTDCSFHRP